jgi:hypothetical protein
MSTHYVRISGNVYGPFSREQLGQMATAGRINANTDLSADRVTWRPASALLDGIPWKASGGGGNSVEGGGSASVAPDTAMYLESLRARTRYPFYRTTILVASILGYIAAASPVILFLAKIIWFGLSSVESYEPFAVIIGAGMVAVFVTVAREMFSMYADFVDSTLNHHAARRRS